MNRQDGRTDQNGPYLTGVQGLRAGVQEHRFRVVGRLNELLYTRQR